MEVLRMCLRSLLETFEKIAQMPQTPKRQLSPRSADDGKLSPQSIATAENEYRDSWTENTITFRVREIPGDYSRKAVYQLLHEILMLPSGDSGNLEICSLAPSYDEMTQFATIRFDDVPDIFKGFPLTSEWQFSVSMGNNEGTVLIFDTHFLGLTVLHDPESPSDAAADVVAISGIGSHGFGSFKERGGPYMWLRDSLPTDFPRLRVSIYGYQSRLDKDISSKDVPEYSADFLEYLTKLTRSRPNLPLVFVAHSFGGIVVKQSLVQISQHADDEHFNPILDNVRGILSFAVPSAGLNIDHLLPIVEGRENEPFLRSLAPGSKYLRDLDTEWKALTKSRNIEVFAFYEALESPTAKQYPDGSWRMAGPLAKLVSEESAVYGASHITEVEQNHSNLIKFKDNDKTYALVKRALRELIEGSIESTEHTNTA